jgi:hypothetical protein
MEFPKLKTGAVAQYPSHKQIAFRTMVARFIDGSEQRFRQVKGPAHRWAIQMSRISAAEMAALEDFFEAAQGQFGNFTFVDPWDGAEYTDCSFDEDFFGASAETEWRWASQLIIRNNQV